MAKPLVHKGIILKPMTVEEARSLDKADVIKFIGPVTAPAVASGSGRTAYGIIQSAYSTIQRRPYTLQRKPKILERPGTTALEIVSSGGYHVFSCEVKYLALVKRGLVYSEDLNRAKRYLPGVLDNVEKRFDWLLHEAKNRMDHYLDKLPLHVKMELFKDFTPKQKALYDFLYSDPEVVMGLKDDPDEGIV